MKRILKQIAAIFCVLLLVASSATTAFAHSGKTDSRGGHKDNKNKSGLGSYHYHCGGYPAHLHTSGYCPYRDVFPSSVSIKSDKTTLGIGEGIAISAVVYPENSCNTNVSWSCSDTSVISLSNGVITAKNYGTATITAETFNGKKGTVKITVKEITADKVSVTNLPDVDVFYIGDTFNLNAQITPENVDNPSITWSSSNEDVATVSSSGSVKLISEGKAEIKASASNGVTGKVSINVREKYVETVEISDLELDVLLGDERSIDVTVLPNDATYPELTWSSDNPDVVSVSDTGKIVALACGDAVVTATSTNGLNDSVIIKVSEIKAEKVDISAPTNILIGESILLYGEFYPSNTTDQQISWSVNDTSIAQISDEGLITAKGVGLVTVTATQKDVSAMCSIEILPIDVEDILITTNMEGSISKDDTVSFYAEVFPLDATYPEITWSVSDPEIASIDENGVLTALKGGTVVVIATAADGCYSEYEVTVSSPAAVAIGTVGIVGLGSAIVLAIKKRKTK